MTTLNSVTISGLDGEEYQIADLKEISHNRFGVSEQLKGSLVATDGRRIPIRIKLFSNVNEAVVNHRIFASKDSLSQYIPRYFGATSLEGKQIPPEDLATRQVGLNQGGYLILEDLTAHVSQSVLSRINDLKFARSLCRINGEEHILHLNGNLSPTFCYLVGSIFQIFSQHSFVVSWSRGPIHSLNLFKFIPCAVMTGSILRDHFRLLPTKELERVIQYLIQVKEAVKESHFVFNDSSLLFIETGKGAKRKLDIKLIDMNHAFEDIEELEDFQATKSASMASLDDLIRLATAVQFAKTNTF